MTAAKHATGTLPIKAAITLTYMLFGALLNSVGAVNLLVVETLGVPREQAALLDAWKDLPIAITSFLVASLLPRLGLKRSMLLALAAYADRVPDTMPDGLPGFSAAFATIAKLARAGWDGIGR